MKKIILIVLFISNIIGYTAYSYAKESKIHGVINSINTTKLDISISDKIYKLSNTVKTYGLGGNKYIDVKNLHNDMAILFKFSKYKGKDTVSEIWVIPN